MQILVFKTNLVNHRHVRNIEPWLDVHPHIMRWNVDLHDCDKILRIETEHLQEVEIEKMLSKAGYYCEALS